jgi:uncharacterized protein YcnI
MRCSGWSSLAISACSAAALMLPGPAAAHVVATPTFLASGSSESVTFSAPNERDDPMTAFALTVPVGVEISHAHEVEGWDESVEGSTATWLGGPLASGEEIAFGMTLEADAEPSIVELQAEQRYSDGEVVAWPVSLTITPADDSPSRNRALVGVIALIGLLSVAAVAMLAWRRRPS